ncbi:MAG: hypothetical protein JRN15_01015 [Nitrososphaerota archaeon]|nr:hypothetical protein [Nitrososphaerota archaeon]
MPSKERLERVPYFSILRFGPGMIVILAILAIVTFLLFHIGAYLYSSVFLVTLILIFVIKSGEVLLEGRPEQKTYLGRECRVIVGIDKGKRGVVKLLRSDGNVDPELWSAESDSQISAGELARVIEMRTIVLVVEPIPS